MSNPDIPAVPDLLARAVTALGGAQRPGQIQMAEAVAHAFATGEHLAVQAGTGTGKSLAYLLPAIFWSLRNKERVVVSTNTINLQEQLIRKDIPFLAKHTSVEFKAALIKGRSNYACLRKLEHALVGRLSGGERRMVSVGRALMVEASLYLIDEPSLGLAPKISASVIEALFALPKDGRAMVIAEQNVALLSGRVDRMVGMHAGRIRGDVGHVSLH